jgi:hypothetical protein
MLTRRSESGVWVTSKDVPDLLDEAARSAVEGERRLLIAVLASALRGLFRDAEKPGRGAARRLRQDLRWLTSHDRTEIFAFERICEALSLDPDRIRGRILNDLGVQTMTAVLEPPPPRRRQPSVRPMDVEPFTAIAV